MLDPKELILQRAKQLTAGSVDVVPVDGSVFSTDSPSLLDKLAIAGKVTIGDPGGTPRPARERALIDVAATDLYLQIRSDAEALYVGSPTRLKYAFPDWVMNKQGDIVAWRTELGSLAWRDFRRSESLIREARADTSPYALIRGWLSELEYWDADQLSTAQQILGRWISQITNMFDPPSSLEVTRPCPSCHFLHHDADNGVRSLAIRVIIADNPYESYAVCAHCGTTWVGWSALEALSDRLDADTRHAETKAV